MKSVSRGVAMLLLCFAVSAVPSVAASEDKQPLSTERDKVSYMIGMDIAKSLAQAAPDMDVATFERSLSNALDGGKPLLDAEQTTQTGKALMQRIAARNGKPATGAAPGTASADIDKGKVGLLIGADVGRSLVPIKDELTVTVLMQGLRTALDNGTPLLDKATADALRESFSQRVRAQSDARNAKLAETNAAAGRELLARNRQVKGVFTTPSGLQYSVVKPGSGRRPLPSDRVRVNYRGTLIDGTVFDSSYDRGEPAEFALSQVIAGWTEGLALMPVGSTYRFWIPADLGYGAKGNPSIGPNSTLVFDVELLDVL